MFYLGGRNVGDAKMCSTPRRKEDEFGWWLDDRDIVQRLGSSHGRDCKSSGSSASMLSCLESDDTENYSMAQEFSKDESGYSGEKIELTPLTPRSDKAFADDDGQVSVPTSTPCAEFEEMIDDENTESWRGRGTCYTPERLVRSQEYRILMPAPRYLSISQTRVSPESEAHRSRRNRRLNYLIVDSKHGSSSQLQALLDPDLPEIRSPPECGERNDESPENSVTRFNFREATENLPDGKDSPRCKTRPVTLHSVGSSCEGLNVAWESSRKSITRGSSLEDTSGIQSNDWSCSDTHSESQTVPACLCTELALATRNSQSPIQGRRRTINDVASVLDKLQKDIGKGCIPVEDDRFCDSHSSHDHLTRLALSIETDEHESVIAESSESLIPILREKVDRLEDSNKDIYKDICTLRRDFQCDEKRVMDLCSSATKLRQDIQEMRYLDDLLRLLQGELERISNRNWPFVIGHTEQYGRELNLIV